MNPTFSPRLSFLHIFILFGLCVVFLGGYDDNLKRLAKVTGIDFYQYWGTGVALASGRLPEANILRNEEGVRTLLNDIVDHDPTDPLLRAVNQYRRNFIEFAGTPLLFSLWSLVKMRGFSESFFWFSACKILLLIAGIVLVGRTLNWDLLSSLTTALVLPLFFQPAILDIVIGNINSIQFFGVSLVFYIMHIQKLREKSDSTGLYTLSFILSAFFVFLKPNILLLFPFVFMHLLAQPGPRRVGRILFAAGVVVACFLVFPMIQFAAPDVWLDWYHRVLAPDDASGSIRLFRTMKQGNYSTLALLQGIAGVAPGNAMRVLIVFLFVSLLLALFFRAWRLRALPPAGSGHPCRWGIHAIVADAKIMIALALVLSTALIPMLWAHYLVVMIVPALFLIGAERYLARLCGLATLVCASDLVWQLVLLLHTLLPVPQHLSLFTRLYVLHEILLALSWLPAWLGLLSLMAQPHPNPGPRRQRGLQGVNNETDASGHARGASGAANAGGA
ncbi:MAG: hypothetical protein HQL66_11155 [Magnetococcales bacterium]|nr:hypothetical protein [Magnetococcales bacterium]